LLSFLDHALPDEARFRMLKAIFLSGFTGDGRFSSRILPEQFMFICKKLSPGEAVTLCAAYKISEGFGSEEGSKGVPVWPERVAEISGLHSRSLVEFYEEGLIEKHLVVPRKLSDDAGKARRRWFRRTDPQTVSERHQSAFGKCGRLTDLGYSLCEHIYKYDDPLDAKERDSGFDS
jgi:hypothetical protein